MELSRCLRSHNLANPLCNYRDEGRYPDAQTLRYSRVRTFTRPGLVLLLLMVAFLNVRHVLLQLAPPPERPRLLTAFRPAGLPLTRRLHRAIVRATLRGPLRLSLANGRGCCWSPLPLLIFAQLDLNSTFWGSPCHLG